MRINKKIAVIMCLYINDCHLKAKKAIDSIINQSVECKLFIYADGPLSKEMLRLLNNYPSIYIYFAKKNLGLASGLNFLIDYTLKKGFHYIARMDADDISHNNRLSLQAKFLNEHDDVDVLGTGFREYGSDLARQKVFLPERHDSLIDYSITRCPFMHPTVMFKAASLASSGIRYPTDKKLTEDIALWHEMIKKKFIFHNLQKVLLDFYIDDNTISRRRGFNKAYTELKLRLIFMNSINRFSYKSFFMLCLKFISQLLPGYVLRFAYKYLR